MRPIDADVVAKRIVYCFGIDLVPVVRCKECKHGGESHRKNVSYLYCDVHNCWMNREGYCHMGRQRGDSERK